MAAPVHQQPTEEVGLGPADRAVAWRWLFVAAAAYLVGQLLAVAFEAVGVSITGAKGGVAALARSSSPPVWFILATFAGLWIGFGGAAWVVTRSGRRVGLRFEHTDIWYVFVGLALQLAVYAAYAPFNLKGTSRAEHELLGTGSGWPFVLLALLTIVGAPLFEELFFRGTLLRGLLVACRTTTPTLGVVVAVVVDGTIFGLAHLGTDVWAQLPGLVLVGIVLATLAVRTRRLGPSIMTHASFNALAVYIYWVTR